MANITINKEILETIATMEADALAEGLKDLEMRKNPAFLAKVRQFLKDNNINTTEKVEGVRTILNELSTIPDFEDEIKDGNNEI